MWLHADVGHFATNATFGLVLLGLVMGRYGTGVGLLAAHGIGLCKPEDMQPNLNVSTFQPRIGPAEREQALTRWREALARV